MRVWMDRQFECTIVLSMSHLLGKQLGRTAQGFWEETWYDEDRAGTGVGLQTFQAPDEDTVRSAQCCGGVVDFAASIG